jgi:small subunit ribosomal protein S14
MAKTSAIERNKKRQRMAARFAARRERLKAAAKDESLPQEERFAARLKLAAMPRNSSKTRVRSRCQLTGRPRAVYRKLRLSRIMVKSSW